MDKKTLRAVMAAFLLGAVPAFAGSYSVGADQAKAMVQAWAAENTGGLGVGRASVVSAAPFTDKDGALLWYAVTLSDGSCVFTSADTRIEPVIAVVANCDGVLPAAHPLRALLQADLGRRLRTVSRASGAGLQAVTPAAKKTSAAVAAARAKWARYAPTAALQDVSPTIATPNGNPPLTLAYLPGFSDGNDSHRYLTHWNQSYANTSYDMANSTWPLTSVNAPLYNYYTPGHYVCGCVATAGATVLQYFAAPEGPVSVTNKCSVNGEPVELTTVGGAYDWSILPRNMGGAAPEVDILSEAQRELVGRVTYDVGVLVGMGYTQSESGAVTLKLADVYKEHYGFATAVAYSEGEFDKAIYNHLRCDSPVLLSIQNPSGGHAVVAVGYGRDAAGSDYTRVFMGWGGSADAWYQLPNVDSFDTVSGAIGMLSLDGACVPFVGQVKAADGRGVTGAEVSIPGVTNVLTGANGLYAFRLTEEAAKQVTEIQITAGSFSTNVEVVVGDDLSSADALPDAVEVTLPADAAAVPSCVSPVDAVNRALHSTPQRLVCLLSGRDGDPGTEAVKAYLAANAAAFNEKFVFYFADLETDGYYLQDGCPSLGVFNPKVFDPANGWLHANGRMAKLAVADGEIPADGDIAATLDLAWAKWQKMVAGVVLTVEAGRMVEVETPGGGLSLGGPKMAWTTLADAVAGDPAVGAYTNRYGNGEAVTLTCAPVCTNLADGVVYRCTGWELRDAADLGADPIDSGDGCEAAVTLAQPDQVLRWIVEPELYRVVVDCTEGRAPGAELADQVSPTEAWVAPGETLEIVATPYQQGNYIWQFKQWAAQKGSNKEDKLDDRVATIVVDGPRKVLVSFARTSVTPALQMGTVTVGVTPAAVAAEAPKTKFGGMELAYGEATKVVAGSVVLAPTSTSFIDKTGTNWVLKGWTNGAGAVDATGSDARVAFELAGNGSAAFDWVWEATGKSEVATSYEIKWTNSMDNLSSAYTTNLMSAAQMADAGLTLDDITVTAPKGFKAVVKEVDGTVVAKLELDDETLAPAVGSGLTIVPQADGSVLVQGTVLNGVKGFWYALYSADELTGPWTVVSAGEYAAGSPTKQAKANAKIEVTIAVLPEAAQKFYKLRVSDIDPANNN